MSSSYLRQHFNTRQTPQSQPIPGSGQTPNNAGGFGWTVDDWTRLDRFLILGSEGGTYYVGEATLTRENAEAALRCVQADGLRTVQRIVEVSDGGLAPKNDPTLFVLALAATFGDLATRRAAFDALPQVARIGTHLFHFADYASGLRGWGRGLRRAISNWYLNKPADKLAYDVVKYQQRDGWSHRDLLRLAHPHVQGWGGRFEPPYEQWVEHASIFDWVTHGSDRDANPDMIRMFEYLKNNPTDVEAARRYILRGLPREALPTELLNDPMVWEALLSKMPPGALIRNLGKATSIGALSGQMVPYVVEKLTSAETLKQARVHPMALLMALKVYAGGGGFRGKLKWVPNARIIDALSDGFYAACKGVEPTGKRILVAVDTSGSMSVPVVGQEFMTCKEAAAAMASVFLRTEPQAHVVSFNTRVDEPGCSPNQRIDDVQRSLDRFNGGTDLAQPILYAMGGAVPTHYSPLRTWSGALTPHLIASTDYGKQKQFDAFVILTDNETWAGYEHPAQALRRYRETVNPKAKLVCMSMAANHTSVVDPNDTLSLGIAGLDASAPGIVANFLKD